MRIHRTQVLTLAALAAVVASFPTLAAQDGKEATPDPVLAEVVAGDWRTPEAKARDAARHPIESLTFWGLKPGMTILEIQPGSASWWTEILAPYAKRTGGKFYVTGADLANPELPEAARKARADFEARYAAKPDLYGKVGVVDWGAKSAPLPADTFDLILTARSVHGWMGAPGMVEKTFREFHDALKPGGILALEQHRANPGPQDPKAESGSSRRPRRRDSNSLEDPRSMRTRRTRRTILSAYGPCRRRCARRRTVRRSPTRLSTTQSTSRSASLTG